MAAQISCTSSSIYYCIFLNFVFGGRSTTLNVLTPTLVGIMLFVNHILSDILCCSILMFRLMQLALQGRFAVQCSLLGGLP